MVVGCCRSSRCSELWPCSEHSGNIIGLPCVQIVSRVCCSCCAFHMPGSSHRRTSDGRLCAAAHVHNGVASVVSRRESSQSNSIVPSILVGRLVRQARAPRASRAENGQCILSRPALTMGFCMSWQVLCGGTFRLQLLCRVFAMTCDKRSKLPIMGRRHGYESDLQSVETLLLSSMLFW